MYVRMTCTYGWIIYLLQTTSTARHTERQTVTENKVLDDTYEVRDVGFE